MVNLIKRLNSNSFDIIAYADDRVVLIRVKDVSIISSWIQEALDVTWNWRSIRRRLPSFYWVQLELSSEVKFLLGVFRPSLRYSAIVIIDNSVDFNIDDKAVGANDSSEVNSVDVIATNGVIGVVDFTRANDDLESVVNLCWCQSFKPLTHQSPWGR